MTLHPKNYWEVPKETVRVARASLEFKKKYSCRAGIEGTISQGVRKLDLRRTRYSGLAKTHLQHIAIACAMNLSRFFAQSNGLLKAQTRTSSFARLRRKYA
jgi:transposase